MGGTEDVGEIDWDWLAKRPATQQTEFVRHLRLEQPLLVLMDGHKGHGAILRDGRGTRSIKDSL